MTIPAGDINVKVLLQYPHPQPLTRARERGASLCGSESPLGCRGGGSPFGVLGGMDITRQDAPLLVPRTGEEVGG